MKTRPFPAAFGKSFPLEHMDEKSNRIIKYIALAFLFLCALLLCAAVVISVRSRAADASLTDENAVLSSHAGSADSSDPSQETFELLPDPTPAPVPYIRFDENPGDAFLQDGYRHELGTACTLGGTVESNYPITAVTVSVSCAYNNDNDTYPYKKTVHPSGDVLSFSLGDNGTKEKKSLAELVNFREFQPGVHTAKLIVTTSAQKSEEVLRVRFYVLGTEWCELKQEDFNNSYDEALAFFKDPVRFVYRYQWVNGRYTVADPDWEETYITNMPGLPEGSDWRVHVDAVPYLEKAKEYLETSYVRVHGSNGDSGILRASDLISEYNGAYVSRFTSSLKSVSHHAFGTAIDLNASMGPNKNTHDNKDLIDKDVNKHLKYNGILYDDNGIPYYDFTYDGSCASDSHSVPQTCVNFLLYELGFYRAGFLWAHYYNNTSDAMHFTLSEQVSGGSHDGRKSLRKVFDYAPPVMTDETGTVLIPDTGSSAPPSPSPAGAELSISPITTPAP